MPTFRTDDGAELHYKVEGHDRGNPDLIFIHGWCSNLNHWEEQASYFQDSHRILRMDRRGMGQSTTPGSGHTPQQHAADIAALARHAGLYQGGGDCPRRWRPGGYRLQPRLPGAGERLHPGGLGGVVRGRC